MNLDEAQRILGGTVVFGDASCIEAKNYLVRLAEVRARLTHCKWCGGMGAVRRGRKREVEFCRCVRDESPALRTDLGVSDEGL